jgi:CRP/FNR family cyclic AMP-dependent transcriptional regulator
LDKQQILQASPLFEMLAPPELAFLADLCKPARFIQSEVIFEEGDVGDSLYVIVNGQVEVLHRQGSDGERILAVLQAPDFFGEMSLVDKDYRSATVRAKSDVALLHLTAENLMTFRKSHKDGFSFLLVNIARVLSARLREANARLVALHR